MGCLKGGRNLDFPVTPIDHRRDALRDAGRIDEIRGRGRRVIPPLDLLVQMLRNRSGEDLQRPANLPSLFCAICILCIQNQKVSYLSRGLRTRNG